MPLVASTRNPPANPFPANDPAAQQRNARRELLVLLGITIGLVTVAGLLGRSALALAGPPQQLRSWNDVPPGVAALRVMRVVLLGGSVSFLIWLSILAAMCVPRSAATTSRVDRLPFGRLVRHALIGTVALALLGSTGGNALASSRPAVVADDATGGQRWPDLPQQTATTGAPDNSPAPPDSGTRNVEAPTTRPLAAPTSSTKPMRARSNASTAAPPGDMAPAGPRISEAVEPRFGERPSSTAVPDSPPSATEVIRTRTVRAGESFWSIAEDEVLTSVDEATESDVARYWQRLVAQNRFRLPDPNNPDLLWVGIVLNMPRPSGPTPTAV